jgi:hypothetical protein
MARRVLHVTLPDGRIASRTTDRLYTDAVAILHTPWGSEAECWGVVRWSTSLDRAWRYADSAELRRIGYTERRVLPVEGGA